MSESRERKRVSPGIQEFCPLSERPLILLGEEAKCSVPVFASFRVIAVWRFLFIEKGMVLEEGTTRSNTLLTVPCCQHHFPVAIFLDRLLPFSYIQLIPKQVLIISSIIFLIKTRKFRRFQWITM